jgi:hypothetical protein
MTLRDWIYWNTVLTIEDGFVVLGCILFTCWLVWA